MGGGALRNRQAAGSIGQHTRAAHQCHPDQGARSRKAGAQPPRSIVRMVPDVQPAAGLARNATALPISAGAAEDAENQR